MRWMHSPRLLPVLVLLVAISVTACAATPLGKAVETTDIQKQLIERGSIEFMKLHYRKVIDDKTYAQGRDLYAAWAAAETRLALDLARWKTNDSEANGVALQNSLDRWTPTANAYLDFIGRFVDLVKVKQGLK